MKQLTFEKAKTLKRGTILYRKLVKNADGTPQRWRVNGKIKLWKKDKERISIPVKHGLYFYGYIEKDILIDFMIDE